MIAKPQAIEYLRGTNSLNHEPLRNIEQDWLDRMFSVIGCQKPG